MTGLSKEITEGLATIMNRLAQDQLPEYDSTQLSPVQKEIVHSNRKRIIVVAGAGSGKTRVLTERIKFLITERKVDPCNIVAITFTNMAADEMRERLLNIKGIGDAFIGTIHSFANKIFANSGSEYEIFNDYLDNKFHKYLIDKYCTYLTMEKYLKYKDLKILVDEGKVSESTLKEFFLPSESYELSEIERKKSTKNSEYNTKFPETIYSLMKDNNVITFDQLIQEATKYFKSLNSKLEYLLVDEFQDIGGLEYDFIKNLNAENNFFVGDDWQSIYGFKGGNVNIFKSIVKNNSYKVYYLLDNYRNGSNIIDLASKVINQVKSKLDKTIVPKSGKDGVVIIDSKYKVDEYLKKIKQEGNYGNWFILVRTNKDIFRVSTQLEINGIPFSTFKKSDMTLAEMRLEMSNNTIKLLTIHTAKGLESKNVMVIGNFPIKQAPYLKNSDERKVMYVALTRAEEKLILLN